MAKFKYGKLRTHGNNIHKRWYIDYKVLDPQTGNLTRKREYVSNKDTSIRVRLDRAHKQLHELNTRLNAGWNPLCGDAPNEGSLLDAVNQILEIKRSTLRPKSIKSYNSIVKRFTRWLAKKKMTLITPELFRVRHAQMFCDYLILDEKIGNTTFNNNLTSLRAVFNAMIDREIIDRNPFRGVKFLVEKEANKEIYTKAELRELFKFLETRDPQVNLFCKIVFYTAYRPSEILRLKIGDIDFDARMLRMSPEVNKSRRQRSMVVKHFIMEEFEKLKGLSLDHYIFSSELLPGTTPGSYNVVQKRFKKYRKELGIKRTVYELKHTMATLLLKNGADIQQIQHFLGHTKVETTMKYLRGLSEFYAHDLIKLLPDIEDL